MLMKRLSRLLCFLGARLASGGPGFPTRCQHLQTHGLNTSKLVFESYSFVGMDTPDVLLF